jgi:hypothetical protein
MKRPEHPDNPLANEGYSTHQLPISDLEKPRTLNQAATALGACPSSGGIFVTNLIRFEA